VKGGKGKGGEAMRPEPRFLLAEALSLLRTLVMTWGEKGRRYGNSKSDTNTDFSGCKSV